MSEADRDRAVARASVRPRSECPHCNPGAANQDKSDAAVLADAVIGEAPTADLLRGGHALTRRIHDVEKGRNAAELRAGREALAAEVMERALAADTAREWGLWIEGDPHGTPTVWRPIEGRDPEALVDRSDVSATVWTLLGLLIRDHR